MKTKKKKSRKTKFVGTSSSPPPEWPTEREWKDIERKLSGSLASNVLPKNAGPVDRAKAEICEHFVKYRLIENITQRELATRLGISESRVSEIVHYQFERYTIDKLLELLSVIKPDVKVNVA